MTIPRHLNTLHVSVQRYYHHCFQQIANRFKYITCFGSTNVQRKLHLAAGKFKYITCFGSTQVQRYLERQIKKFKYITCFGSTTVKSTNQIHKNLCISRHSTIPKFFPNRKQPFDNICINKPSILILQYFYPVVTKKRLGKMFQCYLGMIKPSSNS